LCDGIVFAEHNLASDRSFNEFHLILCRNVMIYFGRELQQHVHELFLDSLVPFGLLGLGRKEAISDPEIVDRYEPLDPAEKLFRRRPR
jgi:chemotaxis protein methyltransferase CheR